MESELNLQRKANTTGQSFKNVFQTPDLTISPTTQDGPLFPEIDIHHFLQNLGFQQVTVTVTSNLGFQQKSSSRLNFHRS